MGIYFSLIASTQVMCRWYYLIQILIDVINVNKCRFSVTSSNGNAMQIIPLTIVTV